MQNNNFPAEHISLKQTNTWTDYGDYEQDVTYTDFDVYENGKKIGFIEHETFTGYITGQLYNRQIPSFNIPGNTPQEQLNLFLNSHDGKRWLSNIYKDLSHQTNNYQLKSNY